MKRKNVPTLFTVLTILIITSALLIYKGNSDTLESLQNKKYVNDAWVIDKNTITDIDKLKEGFLYDDPDIDIKLLTPDESWETKTIRSDSTTCFDGRVDCFFKYLDLWNPEETLYLSFHIVKNESSGSNEALITQEILNNYVSLKIDGVDLWLPIYHSDEYFLQGGTVAEKCGEVFFTSKIYQGEESGYVGKVNLYFNKNNNYYSFQLCRAEANYKPSVEEVREMYSVIKSIKWD